MAIHRLEGIVCIIVFFMLRDWDAGYLTKEVLRLGHHTPYISKLGNKAATHNHKHAPYRFSPRFRNEFMMQNAQPSHYTSLSG